MVWLLNIFRCLCIVTTGAMVGYWIIKFHNNEDTTVIEYRSPKNKMTIYPELTICIRNPFLNVKLKEIDQRLNQETYLQYLKGHHMFNESYGTIDYDHVTVDLFDHLQKLEIYWKDNSNSTCLDKKDCASAIFRNNYNGFASAMFVKCFSLGHISKDDKVPRVIMLTFNATLKNILKNSGYVESLFTYPNQFTRADVKSQYIWYNPEETNIMETFEILSIETVKLRNKWNNPCFVDWMNYDDLLQQKHLKGVGCRPPYLNNLRDFPICNTSQQMKKAKFDFLQLPEDYHLVPCQGIPDVPYKYEQPFPNKTDGFTIVIIYPKNVKTIKQEQLVDLHSLIGNIGGYIGLFLGSYFCFLLIFAIR